MCMQLCADIATESFPDEMKTSQITSDKTENTAIHSHQRTFNKTTHLMPNTHSKLTAIRGMYAITVGATAGATVGVVG